MNTVPVRGHDSPSVAGPELCLTGFIPEATVSICDVTGKVFYTHHMPETGKIVVDCTGIPSGLYVVRIRSSLFTLTKKLLVEK